MAVKQDIQVGMITFIGTVGAMLLLISAWGVEGWFAYEVDLLNEQRYDADKNVEWLDLRNEQYGNLGDTVGNGTIYAAAPPATADAAGYRFTSDTRDTAAIPIHEAMAQVVRQFGRTEVTAEAMRAIDRAPVSITNEAYAGYMVPNAHAADPGGPPTTRPAGTGNAGH